MKNKYLIVRANSTAGGYVVELNQSAPQRVTWGKAHIAGYADNVAEARSIARDANHEDGRESAGEFSLGGI
jgi:hypothetical protein